MTPPAPCGIRSRDQHPSGSRERSLERHCLGQQLDVVRCRVLGDAGMRFLELLFEGRRQHLETWRHRTAGCKRLEHRQRRCEGDALVDQFLDKRFECGTRFVDRHQRLLTAALTRTTVRLLIGHKIGRGEKPMLEIVDSEIGSLAVSDRTEMAGHLQTTFVRFFNGCPESRAGYLHVRLERRRTLARPVRHMLAGIVRRCHRVHLLKLVATVDVRCRGIDCRAGFFTRLDGPLQVQVHIPVEIPAGAHCRHATREIETGEAFAELSVDARSRRVIEMLVHHHEPGDHALAGEVDYFGACRGVTRDESPTSAIVPSRMRIVCFSRAGAPVPSMTRALVSAMIGALVRTYAFTASEGCACSALPDEVNRASTMGAISRFIATQSKAREPV